jgi:hypothetical protein
MSFTTATKVVRRHLRSKELYVTAQAAGNYVSGGDTIDLTKNTVPIGMDSGGFGYPGTINTATVEDAPAGFTGKLIPGTNLTNWKLKVFQTGAALSGPLAELTAAAYPAGATADVFTLRFEGPKLRL